MDSLLVVREPRGTRREEGRGRERKRREDEQAATAPKFGAAKAWMLTAGVVTAGW
ncbi:hypothetical protein [Streptomyces sp. NPDC052127]|uniref:hypothetical protein n=1 Tax=Streptomyces sp. NPDC052127 TaxID=3155679 RepID=UPI003444E3CB